MNNEELGWRMYFLTMYNLSGIQKGIQAGHAAIEYAMAYGGDAEFKRFANFHKTFIVLDGGPSGAMVDHYSALKQKDVKCVNFIEYDLNGAMSAIAFLAPESVYDMQQMGAGMETGPRFGPKSSEPVNVTQDVWLAWFVKQFNLAKN